MARMLILALALLGAPAHTAAAVTWPAVEGAWRGPYRLQGAALELSQEWRVVLSGRFLELRHRVIPPGATAAVFSAQALYHRPDSTGARGEWFDSAGQQRPVRLHGGAPMWTADWGTEATEVGRTSYRLEGDSVLVVADSVRTRAGLWREFGSGRLRRTAP